MVLVLFVSGASGDGAEIIVLVEFVDDRATDDRL
jgi:hypothetical protein